MYGNFADRSNQASPSLSSSSKPGADDYGRKPEKNDNLWRLTVFPMEHGRTGLKREVCTLKETSIVYSESIDRIEASANTDSATLRFIFLLKGAIDIIDSKNRKTHNILPGNAAGIFYKDNMKARISANSSWVTFIVPLHTLRENFERLTQKPFFPEISFSLVQDFRKGNAAALYQTLCHVSEDLANATPVSRDLLAGVYERLLLAKLFMTKPDNLNVLSNAQGRRIAPRYLQNAEAFMRENIYRDITLDDVADAAGCSSRALQRIFKEYRNETPMHILSKYRLSAAHDAILNGTARNVTDLAIQLQFSNPGRFSSLFRSAYGMTPSAMMRFHEKSP